MVYGLCRVLLRDADEAEDAAQQVFLSAHRSMLGGTQPREPAAWLAAIARNECRGRIRARMGTPLALVDEQSAVAADVEQVAAQRAEVEALCAALVELPQQQRQALVLREFYGLSYDEVRAALGLTDAAVESLLFRARRRLQAELRPAQVASGALALPLALREALAAAVPGFAGASSGGAMAKLASLPLIAKLAGAAATLTAAGTIGFVELENRDHDPVGARTVPASPRATASRPARAAPVRLVRASDVDAPARPSRRHEADDEQEEEADEAEEREVADEAEADEAENEDEKLDEADEDGGESDDSGSGSGEEDD